MVYSLVDIGQLLFTARRGNIFRVIQDRIKTTMGNNKKITCRKCFRVMRKDNLKRHMERHENENYQNEMICSSSIATSRTSLQEVETESNFSSISTNTSTPINEEFVIKSMVIDSDKYM